MKRARWIALGIAFAMVLAACTSDDGADTTAADEGTATTEEVDLSQGADLTFHMVTHADDGVFWSVVKRGAEDAAAALGVNLVWSPSFNDPEKQVQDIEAAIAAGTDGLAVSLASPEAVGPAAKAAADAGIPLYTINSGVNQYKDLGATTHVGQTEIVAGNGAGEFFNSLGATKVLCARQEQGNIGLEERCQGLEETFNGDVVSEFIGGDDDPTGQEATISALLAADEAIDGILGTGPNVAVRAVEACVTAGRTCFIGGFDISTDIINLIESGDIAFTVDQQQYLQGYLPIVLLFLEVTNLNTAGGGLPILTGPGFVTTANAGEVKALVDAGTR
ncbi:MAG: substrate-binding domain-containing protein [Acidobacteria bacterium]|nr:substrate-binding domain-containing protein [Acidobacteriota bacterium]